MENITLNDQESEVLTVDCLELDESECESMIATDNIMGTPGGTIMEGRHFVYKR